MTSKGNECNEAAISFLNNERNTEMTQRELKDLDADLLKTIFKHLLVNDLVNIVEYDGELKNAALSAFKEKLGDNAITVTNEFNPQNESSSPSVKLLNHFGNEITKLVVNYKEDYREMSNVINDTVVTRCKALQEIEFQNATRFSMFGISQRFESVQTVSFLGGSLCEIVSKFGKWFPKAHSLKLNSQKYGEYGDCLDIEKNLSLKHLEIGKDSRNTSITFLQKLIKMSPELRTLRIKTEYKGSIDLVNTCINAIMPNLESLHLNLRNITDIYNCGNNKPHFKKLQNLTVEFAGSNLKGLPITTENLQTLKLFAAEGFGKDCGDFLINNKNVEVVELDGPYINEANYVISSFSKLSNLKEIKFPFPYKRDKDLQLDQVHKILKDCKSLLKLTIIAEDVSRKKIPVLEQSMNAFAASVGIQWNSSVSKEVITVHKEFFQINYRLSLEKKQSDRNSRMEQRKKRKSAPSYERGYHWKKLKSMKKHLQLKDLNDDCLIVIFKFLSIDDLVHIVQYNNHFICAARIAFKQKYWNNQIQVSVEYNSMTKTSLWCIELLKYFGSEITKLSVKYYSEDSQEIDDSIDNAIIKYCRKSLVEIEFVNFKNSSMNGIRKPFENVCVLSFVRGCVNEIVNDFGKWFPNARTLKLKSMDKIKELKKINMKPSPSLQHFEIHTQYDDVFNMYCGLIIINNRQLKSFYHRCNSYSYDYDNVGAHQTLVNFPMPNLERLHLILPRARQVAPAEIGYDENRKIHFEMLRHLHIEFKDSVVLANLPIRSNYLETLTLIGLDKCIARDCVSLIRDNENVKSIKIAGCMVTRLDWDVNALSEILPELPNLNELELPYDRTFGFLDPTFHVDYLLEHCKSLLKLVMNCNCQRSAKEIQDQFNSFNDAIKSVWKISNDTIINDNHRNNNRYRITFEKQI